MHGGLQFPPAGAAICCHPILQMQNQHENGKWGWGLESSEVLSGAPHPLLLCFGAASPGCPALTPPLFLPCPKILPLELSLWGSAPEPTFLFQGPCVFVFTLQSTYLSASCLPPDLGCHLGFHTESTEPLSLFEEPVSPFFPLKALPTQPPAVEEVSGV